MAKTPPFSVCYEYCVGGGGTNENGIIVVNTEYESADAIPVFTKTGEVAKKLNDVHCGVFKVSFKESEYNGVSTALIFQTTWWGPTNNATENCYQLMYECNGLFRIREEITITVFKTLAWKAIDISNKKTVINNRADDESYPTTLAVKKFVDAHTSNGDIHVTLEDKQKWNDKYTKEEVNSKFALIENGIIEVKETVVGNLNNILVYDKNGNVATDIENIHTGTFRLFVKYEDENPDVIFIQPDGYLLMEQRVMTFDGMGGNEIVQTILMNNQLYTRVTGDLNFLVGEFGEFAAIDLTPVDTLESDDANAPLSANMGRELNEKKENTSNKSDVIDDTANDRNYPTTKAVKDYVDTSAELNTIVNTAEGSAINITDSANAKLKGLKICGKTTQAAEPSVENPQPLVSVGDGGSVEIKVYDERVFNPNVKPQTLTLNTPNGLPGVPVTSGGNYTDENGQQWICDEIDLARGKYVQRVSKYINTGTSMTINAIAMNTDKGLVRWNTTIPVNSVNYSALSNCFKHAAQWDDVVSYPYYVVSNGKQLYFSVNATDIGSNANNTLDELKTLVNNWIAKTFSEDKPLIVYYALAEPIETDLNLTDEEIAQYKALTTHKPVTNIYNDADAHMKVDYVADPKNYIDNKFANIENAILSLGGNV